MEFEGFDWTELSQAFGLYKESEEDEMTLKKTRDYLLEHHFPKASSEVADTIRSYLAALYDRSSKAGKYSTPVWGGLLEVKDDRTLIKYTIILLEYMWF